MRAAEGDLAKRAWSSASRFPTILRPVGRPGNDLLSRTLARAVPSALKGLTAEFGMGSGVTPSLWSPEVFNSNKGSRNKNRCGMLIPTNELSFTAFAKFSRNGKECC